MSTDSLGNENIDMAVGYSNGYKQGFDDGKKDAVKHGHWIFVKDVVAYIKDMVSYIKCSECGDDICWVNTKRPKYCPSCGARMDGSAND